MPENIDHQFAFFRESAAKTAKTVGRGLSACWNKVKNGERGWNLLRGMAPGLLIGALAGGAFGAAAGALIGFMIDQTLARKDASKGIAEALLSPERETREEPFPGAIALAGLCVWWMRRHETLDPHAMGKLRNRLLALAGPNSDSGTKIEDILEEASSKAGVLDGPRLASAFAHRREPSLSSEPAELLFAILRESRGALTLALMKEAKLLLETAGVPEPETRKAARQYYPSYSNPFEILGIKEDSGREEAKRSFRKLSMMFHPDANANLSEEQKKASEEAFIAIKNAYAQVLSLSGNEGSRAKEEMGSPAKGFSA
jgi:hypothetical protein